MSVYNKHLPAFLFVNDAQNDDWSNVLEATCCTDVTNQLLLAEWTGTAKSCTPWDCGMFLRARRFDRAACMNYLMTSDDLQPNLRASLWPCYFHFIARLFEITLAKPESNKPLPTLHSAGFECLRCRIRNGFICFVEFNFSGRWEICLLIFSVYCQTLTWRLTLQTHMDLFIPRVCSFYLTSHVYFKQVC